jgi:spore germination protein (amino acid permease)
VGDMMKVRIQPEPKLLINTFLIFFVIHSTQIGVGLQGFQRIIYIEAKHDAWISVILAGIATHLVAFIMIKTLSIYGSTDLYGIHHDLFGKWLGRFFSFLYVLYCFLAFFAIMRNYIEVVQAWMFPEVSTWFLSLSLLILIIYGVTGGFRVIIGISFFSIVIGIWLVFMIAYPFQFAHWTNLLPVLEADLSEIVKGAHGMTFTVIGFEILYFIFPFLKEKNKIQKFTHLSLLFTTILYLIVMIVSLAYFSGGQLEKTIWGTLSLFKIVRLPFIERFEYVAIAIWMIIILPNLMLYLWAASRGMNRISGKSEKSFVWIFALFAFITVEILKTRVEINAFNGIFAKASFYVVFCYPFLLFLLAIVKRKFRLMKEKHL